MFPKVIIDLSGSKDPDRRSDNVARLRWILIQAHQVAEEISDLYYYIIDIIILDIIIMIIEIWESTKFVSLQLF